jgi:hypothetical protein
MHRRLLASVSLVIVLSMSVPAMAASRRDSNQNFIERIVLRLKKLFSPTPLDLNDPSPPKP